MIPGRKRPGKGDLRRQITSYVATVFPGCMAIFLSVEGGLSQETRTFGFRIRNGDGYLTDVILVDPTKVTITQQWVKECMKQV